MEFIYQDLCWPTDICYPLSIVEPLQGFNRKYPGVLHCYTKDEINLLLDNNIFTPSCKEVLYMLDFSSYCYCKCDLKKEHGCVQNCDQYTLLYYESNSDEIYLTKDLVSTIEFSNLLVDYFLSEIPFATGNIKFVYYDFEVVLTNPTITSLFNEICDWIDYDIDGLIEGIQYFYGINPIYKYRNLWEISFKPKNYNLVSIN